MLTVFTRMQRRLGNPRALRTAGSPGDAWSVVSHVGRSSGTPYRTPVGVVETEGGYLIALPYGTSADWVQNVRSAGSATIRTEGRDHRVRDPRVVSGADVAAPFSRTDRFLHRLFGVDQFLVLERAAADVAAGADG